MTLSPPQFRYSLTVDAQDDAVLYCLRALWQYAERDPQTGSSWGFAATEHGPVTFRFSSPHNRADFLGEATRLLAGKWTRLGVSDDDPPPLSAS